MKLRNCILLGLGLCILTVVFSALRYPGFGIALLNAPWILSFMPLIGLWYAYVAVRWTREGTSEDVRIRRSGVKWGMAIGCIWAVSALAQLAVPREEPGPPLFIVGLVLPFVTGAIHAIRTGRFRAGLQAGFWTGISSGLIAFLAFAAIGYGRLLISGGDAGFFLVLSFYAVFLFGPLFCPAAGALGGGIGILLARTGRPDEVVVSQQAPHA